MRLRSVTVTLSLLVTAITPIVLGTAGGPAVADVQYVPGDLVPGMVTGDPSVSEDALAVGLSGGTVAASYDGEQGVWTHPVTGTDGWTQASTASFEDPSVKEFTYGGGTVLTETGRDVYGGSFYTVEWPGGRRDLSMSSGRATLSHGGAYVLRTSRSSGSLRTTIEEARTGVPVTQPDNRFDLAVDGTSVWSGSDDGGWLHGSDLVSGTRDLERAGCLNGELLDVRGRWALVDCLIPTIASDLAVDLGGVLGSRWVPRYAELGDGFLVIPQQGSPRLAVQSLEGSQEVRFYGPVPPGGDFAVDDHGSDLVYVDTQSRIRHVDASWAVKTGPRPVPDTTAPAVTLTTPLAPVVRDATSVGLTWDVQDVAGENQKISGVETIDVRRSVQGADDWVYPTSWQGQRIGSTFTVYDSILPNTGRCYAARSTDRVGNTGAWTAPVCQYSDNAPPVLGPEGGSAEFVPWTSGTITYTWSSPSRWSPTFDLGVRSATAGRALGTWTTPVAYQTLQATQRSLHVSGAGTERCLRFRVRSLSTTAWSPGRCTALPTDDRSLTRTGRTTRAKSRLAIAGTYTQLAKKGASLTLAMPAGRKVGLWMLRGPGQGTANVYAGKRLLGRVSGALRTNRRELVVLAPRGGFTGAVRVVRTGARPVKVDAVSVLR